MRILVVIYEFPPIGGGGGHAAREICRDLVQRGHEVHVLTAHYKDLPRLEEQEGVQILRVPSARQMPYQAGLLPMSGFVLAGFLAGMRHLRHWTPDLMHVHFAVPSGPVAWALSRFSRIPYVLTAHLGDVPDGVPEKTGNWFRWIFPFTPPIWRDAVQVVAVSEHTRRLASKHYPVDIKVIPNGVNLHKLQIDQIKPGNPPVIVFAGRFTAQKNLLQLVHTLVELRQLRWQCILVGNGPLYQPVVDAIHEAQLQERFIFPGWVTPEEATDWLAKGDILFMPSLNEGLPVVGVKAIAKGLAIIASRIGGFHDIVDEGQNGFLIDLNQPQAYAAALGSLLTHPERLLAFRQASLIKAQAFDIHKVTDAYEAIFKKVSGQSVTAQDRYSLAGPLDEGEPVPYDPPNKDAA